jgi:hypothetical protein
MSTKKKDAAKKPAGKGPSAPTAPPAQEVNKIWKTYHAENNTESHDGYLVTEGNDIDKPIALVPISKDLLDAKAMHLARRIAKTPALRSPCAINLHDFGLPGAKHEMPGWVYALLCEPLDQRGWIKHPEPFCAIRFAKMKLQAAALAAKDDAADVSKGQDVAYWDLRQDFDEIADRVKANGPHSLALAADRASSVEETQSNPMPLVEAWQMREVIQAFWRLPEPERMRIFNGWRWRSAEARESRETVERTCLTNPLLSVLTLAIGTAERRIGAKFEEIATDDMHAVRIHIRVGTTQAEAKNAIEGFHEAVCSDWDKLITDPRGVTPSPRQEPSVVVPLPEPIPPCPTPDAIDRFYSQVKELAERLGLSMGCHETGVLLPDLTVRELYQIEVANDNGTVGMLLGPVWVPEEEE